MPGFAPGIHVFFASGAAASTMTGRLLKMLRPLVSISPLRARSSLNWINMSVARACHLPGRPFRSFSDA